MGSGHIQDGFEIVTDEIRTSPRSVAEKDKRFFAAAAVAAGADAQRSSCPDRTAVPAAKIVKLRKVLGTFGTVSF